MGQTMKKIGERKRKTKSGYAQTSSIYSAQNCQDCQLRGACFKAKGNRIVERNHKLEAYKEKARRNLLSEIGELKQVMHKLVVYIAHKTVKIVNCEALVLRQKEIEL
nr:transposase [Lutibacter sp. HS1-25]